MIIEGKKCPTNDEDVFEKLFRKKEAESMSDTEGTTINPLIMGGSGCSRARRIESKFNKKCNKTIDKIC